MQFYYAISTQSSGKRYVDDWKTGKYICVTGFRIVESMNRQLITLDPASYYAQQYLDFYPLPDSSILLLVGEAEIK